MKRYSLTRRLVATVLMMELFSAVAVTGLSWFYERHTHLRAFDVLVRGHADSVMGAVQDAEDPADNVVLDKGDLDLPRDDIYEVRDDRGNILGRSSGWAGPGDSLMHEAEDRTVRLVVGRRHYRGLLLHGTRRVDPDEGGNHGTLHHVTVFYGSPVDHVWHAVEGAVQFYAISSLLLMAVTGVWMAWLLRRGLSPLRELADEAAKVTASAWSFRPSERAKATLELAPLAAAMEDTLARLEEAFAQQRRFTSDAAHELKTAVAVIKSSLQLLSMRPRDVEEYRSGLERTQTDCARLEEIVARMLALARYEAGFSESECSEFGAELRSIVLKAREELLPVARVRGVELIVDSDEEALIPLAAPEASILVANLAMNALQHSLAGGIVRLAVRQEAGAALLLVTDEGEGMAPEVLAHIFERFYRGDPSRDRQTGGTGLGLSICKALVERSGGSIEVTSQTGRGTRVEVRWPVNPEGKTVPSAEIQARLR